jgi:hypothetical protein
MPCAEQIAAAFDFDTLLMPPEAPGAMPPVCFAADTLPVASSFISSSTPATFSISTFLRLFHYFSSDRSYHFVFFLRLRAFDAAAATPMISYAVMSRREKRHYRRATPPRPPPSRQLMPFYADADAAFRCRGGAEGEWRARSACACA